MIQKIFNFTQAFRDWSDFIGMILFAIMIAAGTIYLLFFNKGKRKDD